MEVTGCEVRAILEVLGGGRCVGTLKVELATVKGKFEI